jgi:hypothetical protein
MSLSELDARAGTGNWEAFPHSEVPRVLEAAEDWQRQLDGLERPWLCWCVDNDWCVLQQRLVQSCGWTPVVGTDGRVVSPTVVEGAVFVDFNARLQLPVMWMHFPLEFVFAFCDRLAFWHSDMLPPAPVMRQIASEFETIRPGEYLGVYDAPGVSQRLRRLWKGVRRLDRYWLRNWNAKRWFEVVGCTTAGASRSQFDHGCGIWRHIERHPHADERLRRSTPHYDHGVGVWHWSRHCPGRVRALTVDINAYHYVTKGRSRVADRTSGVQKGRALMNAYDLRSIADRLALEPVTIRCPD